MPFAHDEPVTIRPEVGAFRVVRLQRLGFAPTTCPTTPGLEELFYPNARTIAAAARDLAEGAATGWVPAEDKEPHRIEFKGPF